jgi:hypothetical protein
LSALSNGQRLNRFSPLIVCRDKESPGNQTLPKGLFGEMSYEAKINVSCGFVFKLTGD